jgi:hypothetical protein
MYNKKLLQQITGSLDKAKAPKKPNDIIVDPRGQWDHPGEITRIPSNEITMQGVDYPVYGVPNVGEPQMMLPGAEYMFPGADYVDEYPQMRRGGAYTTYNKLPKNYGRSRYSSNISATNKLFARNFLFRKEKHKIYDPNAKYEQGGIPNLPLTENRRDYNLITRSFEPKTRMQDGGEQDAMNAMMKARLAYANEFGNPAAQRMINLPDNPYQFDDGNTGTHYMASMDNYAVPQIQDINGQLMLGDYGPESNEAIRFDTDDDANYFAEHYKDVSPGLNSEQIEGYSQEPKGYVENINYNSLPINYADALKNFVYPEVVDSSEETGYDAALGVIKQNPNDPIANVNNPWWYEHELMHHLQNQAGGMSTYGAVGLRPNPYVASDEAIGSYYNRRGSEFETELNRILEENPDISEEEAYARAEEDLYNNPTTTEGEARNYEGYIEAGNPSIFPKKQNGGIILDLTDDEIEEYRKGGYIVEDVSIPSLTKAQRGLFKKKDKQDPNKLEYREPVKVEDDLVESVTPFPEAPEDFKKGVANLKEVEAGPYWLNISREYSNKHNKQAFIDKKKRQYLRNTNRGLAKAAGLNMENFPKDVEKNFINEYNYKRNNYVVKNLFKKAGISPNKREEWVDSISDADRALIKNSKYGNKLSPSIWARTLAGLGTLASKFSPEIDAAMERGDLPGLTREEQRAIKNAKIKGIPVGGLEALAGTDAVGIAIANAVEASGNESYGSGYKEAPSLISGDVMPNITDDQIAVLNPFTYTAGYDFAPLAKGLVKGAAKIGKASIKGGKKIGKNISNLNLKPVSKTLTKPNLIDAKQRGGQTIAVGEVYKYAGRPDSVYKMNEDGEWLIKNPSTKNKYVPIKDPTGSRSAELERNAILRDDFILAQNKRNKQLLDEIENPKSYITLDDQRKVRATSGQKINPNVDLVSGKYNEEVIKKIIKKAKTAGVDPATAIAIALQESRIGQTDSSLGHLLHGETGNPYEYIDFYKEKLDEAKRAKINDELLQIQYYNGLGTVTPKTEKGYHGYEMQKIYGVPIPASGINMRQNPLYGKQIVDIRDNVIKKNKEIQKYLQEKKSGGIVSELTKKEIKDLIAQGYIIEDVD